MLIAPIRSLEAKPQGGLGNTVMFGHETAMRASLGSVVRINQFNEYAHYLSFVSKKRFTVEKAVMERLSQ